MPMGGHWVGIAPGAAQVPPRESPADQQAQRPGGPLGAAFGRWPPKPPSAASGCAVSAVPASRDQVPDVGTPVTAVRAMPAHGRGIPVHQLGYALLTARGFRLVPAIALALSRRRMPRMGWAKYPG